MRACDTMIPIPVEGLESMINKRIHLGWAKIGCVWMLREVDYETGRIRVETVKYQKSRWEYISEAYYTRRSEP